MHELLRSAVGDGPADALAPRHDDAEGCPAAPLPSALLAEKSSDADDGVLPQFVLRLASVGTPGDASAVEHVDAWVGSSTEPTPPFDAANDPVAVATAFARTREPEVETLLWLASAFADGPDTVGADPSGGAFGSGSDGDAVVGTVAVVPGPVAVVEPLEGPLGDVAFELDAVIGSLEEKVAVPASPPLAEADPPAVEPAGSGRMSGCAETVGSSASARVPHTLRSAMTTMSSSSFLIL